MNNEAESGDDSFEDTLHKQWRHVKFAIATVCCLGTYFVLDYYREPAQSTPEAQMSFENGVPQP